VPGRGGVTLTRLVTANPSPSTAPWRRDLLLLAIAFGALYFFVLGRAALDPKDEGRYAEIPREMIATGDWVTPRLDGVTYFEKPPLVYWVEALSQEAFGPGERAVRAPVALFGLAGVLLTYAAARRIFGRESGLAAAAVLGTSLLYAALARILVLDMAVSVLMSATLFCFILGVRAAPGPARRWFFLGLYASAALATLTKGLIGFLLTGAVMFLWLLLFGQWRRLRPLHLPSGMVLFLAIAAPWHILAAQRNPAWAHFYFVHEHWERFTTTEHGRVGPWYYFIPIVFGGLFPWMGFLWPAVRRAAAGGWSARREHADRWFFLVWAGLIFLFFSKSQSKLIPYILPVFPALAVIIGVWLADAWRTQAAAAVRGGVRLFAAFALVLGLAVLVVVYLPGRFRIDADEALALRPYAGVMAAVLLAGAVSAWWWDRRAQARLALIVMGFTGIGLLGVAELATGWLLKPGTKPLAQLVLAQARPGDRIYHYHEFFHDFPFYTGRPVGLVAYVGELEPENDPTPEAKARFIDEPEFRREWTGPLRVFAVARKKDVKELFADPSFHKQLLGESRDHYLFSNRP
jgi:4-amino-4-deoxy-L-arabinose transferase-like glycosyltransferase